MFKTSTPLANKVNVNQIKEAFNTHLPVTVKKHSGEVIGPGVIAIMYGNVAFRMYPKTGDSSHFIRIEEIAELTTGAV